MAAKAAMAVTMTVTMGAKTETMATATMALVAMEEVAMDAAAMAMNASEVGVVVVVAGMGTIVAMVRIVAYGSDGCGGEWRAMQGEPSRYLRR